MHSPTKPSKKPSPKRPRPSGQVSCEEDPNLAATSGGTQQLSPSSNISARKRLMAGSPNIPEDNGTNGERRNPSLALSTTSRSPVNSGP